MSTQDYINAFVECGNFDAWDKRSVARLENPIMRKSKSLVKEISFFVSAHSGIDLYISAWLQRLNASRYPF